MPAFAPDYARVYDLLYHDKNYAEEARYIVALLQLYGIVANDSGNLLDLGCGTGRFAAELTRHHYTLRGIDSSPAMIARAAERRLLHASFEVGDVRTWQSPERFDAAVSLFHVVSYLTTYPDLAAALTTAFRQLRKGGIFIFDFWYGPAVLRHPPEVRMKFVEDELLEVERIGVPSTDTRGHIVEVRYDIQVRDKTRTQSSTPTAADTASFQERHRLRYWFLPELIAHAQRAGFEHLADYTWLTRQPLQPDAWNGVMVLRK